MMRVSVDDWQQCRGTNIYRNSPFLDGCQVNPITMQ